MRTRPRLVMMDRIRTFFANLWSLFWFVIKLTVGLLLATAAVRLLNTAFWQDLEQRGLDAWPVVANLETAVRVVAIFFAVTWGLRLLDRLIWKNRLRTNFGVQPGQRNLFHAFTSPFLHNDEEHLFNNTFRFLLYTAFSILLTPNLESFAVATIVILLIKTLGIWMFGDKNSSHAGASGLIFGYFGFILSYGFLGLSGWWQQLIAALVALLHTRRTYILLRHPPPNVSQEGHFWGLIGGLFATIALVELGAF